MNPLSLLPGGLDPQTTGIVVIDHGSRVPASNRMLLEVVELFGRLTGLKIVEPAHMEQAEPSIRQAFDRCVERGARRVICHPYFLLPGRHWSTDIPALAAQAAAAHPGVQWLVTAPLGLHEAMIGIMADRIAQCVAHAGGLKEDCDLCRGTGRCAWNGGAEKSGA